ncbi:hypothetical protein [Paenibacillus sacheonensis]|uniref:Exosporium protein C n=1 Tax=Paenibacillus sacheonensis TaxID=742054 RepID=A0A7X4YJD4_9BACL|nr:hypothetical protein [Paenibacillus sacheonensis]MBM7564211.1 hypothetical protein [Paenibacillus sacheonensis]NBC67466.1 hypothetical protein [Paenibacillus sacheonensis]
MPFSTGLISNTSSTGIASANVVVNARNITNVEALVLIEVYVVPESTQTLNMAYLTGFMLAAKSSGTREFFIGGAIAYEVQLSVVGPVTEVVLSVFGLDESGNIVHGHRVLHEELTVISTLSTSPE